VAEDLQANLTEFGELRDETSSIVVYIQQDRAMKPLCQ